MRRTRGRSGAAMRWCAVMAACIGVLSGCATAHPEADVAARYQPYTCIPPSRPILPSIEASSSSQRVSVIGDSLTNGSPEGGTGTHRWTAVVERELRARGVDVVINFGAEGGSGYVSQGNRGGVFADKIESTVKPDDRLVVFFGSRNDSGALEGELAHATCDALREAEVAAPGAQLLVIGPMGEFPETPHSLVRARDIIRDRAEDLNARFLDPLTDNWFLDRQDLIGADGVHPTDEGHAYMAQRIAPVIQEMLTAPRAS
ncbi:SGNH/GDSL hydrolase family protein [Mycolicibacterium confluentis]|uniref:SGNH/GDSL hydrolase family protein n=1 Tax=Mycolicibacterium confluentis TaxID=28047 RepID=UPI0013D3D6C2|nr:SGNH/GDSL hydrolase family protein [Mycolicibacterium confluentis]MCV7319876.1 SGNH/GDSL hydrolase family protein [Mycolicibacterium confluentis]